LVYQAIDCYRQSQGSMAFFAANSRLTLVKKKYLQKLKFKDDIFYELLAIIYDTKYHRI